MVADAVSIDVKHFILLSILTSTFLSMAVSRDFTIAEIMTEKRVLAYTSMELIGFT